MTKKELKNAQSYGKTLELALYVEICTWNSCLRLLGLPAWFFVRDLFINLSFEMKQNAVSLIILLEDYVVV